MEQKTLLKNKKNQENGGETMAKRDDSVKKKVPELRFAGFADDWEECKLKELFQPSKNKNNNGLYNQKDILAASLGTELIPKRTFFGLKSTKESVKNYRIVKTGDLIYTKSPIKGFPNGIIRSNKGNVGIVPPLYCVYTLQKDINSSIIQLYFEDKNRLNFYLFPLVNVGARNNVNITDLEFLEGKVTIPNSYEEQSKIVQFMEQLNRTIALHQRKLDLLKEQKKGFLQKMFPKNGEKVPELRFAGFADDWEQRKFSDIVVRLNKSSNNNQLPKVEFEDIIAGEGRLNKDISRKFDDRKGTLFEPDNILYGKLRPYLKNWLFSDFKGIALGDFWVFKSINSEPKFVYSLIQADNYQRVANDTSGTKMPRSDWKKVSSSNFSIPTSLEEQQKIGSFFKQLDDTIALHQRKLDLLKEQKKGFLQKMFV